MGVKQDETFSYFLQEKLKSFQVVNTGVGGAGIQDMYDAFENFKKYNIKLVILTVLDIDVTRVKDDPHLSLPPKNIVYSWDDVADHIDYDKSLRYNLKYLDKMIKYCNFHKIEFILTLWPRNIFRAKINYLSHIFKKTANNNNIYYIDDYQDYLNVYKNEKLIVSEINWHPSILCHKLIANRLFDFIIENKILQLKNAKEK